MTRGGVFLLSMLFTAPLMAADLRTAEVETVALKQQQMPETVSGYGVVSPDTGALQSKIGRAHV